MFNKLTQETPAVRAEAERCLYCVDAPCKEGCPAGIDIAQFIRHLRYDDLKSAKKLIKDKNPLGGICGYLCPSEELCQKRCTRAKLDEPIRIRELQKYICDRATYSAEPGPTGDKKVAVVGAGPAGLACATMLARGGVKVEVFDRQKKPGGLVFGEIPEYRVPDEVVARDLGEIADGNVTFCLGKEVGVSDIAAMMKQYDAVFLGTGLEKDRNSGVELAASTARVVTASQFLSNAKSGKAASVSGIVYIVGGGDSAIDAAETAIKRGADRAVIVYRRSRREMPATDESLFDAVDGGVEILYNTTITKIEAGDPLKITFVQNQLVEVAGEERRSFKEIEGSEFASRGDMVVLALGKRADESLTRACEKDGRVDDHLRLGFGNVFAGGDLVNGGKTVVEAVKQGKLAAESILEFLKGK